MPHVAVVIPGIMGSRLKLADELVWPGPVLSLVLPYSKITELLSPKVVADGSIRQYVTTLYQPLFDDLETWGFHDADRTLIDAAYDWRKDITESAEVLAGHLDDAVALHGPQTEISLVAHSMGGLVSRYYLESSVFRNREAFRCVKRLVTLGTPHRGAAIALPMVLGEQRCLFLSAPQVLQCARNPRYPSSYQLLPAPGEPFLWNAVDGCQSEPLDIYDPKSGVAAALGLIEENLEATRRFHAVLDPAKRPHGVRYFCIAGSRQVTATHLTIGVEGSQGKLTLVEPEDGGDGTVPIWSSFLPGMQRLFVGGEHSTIYKNVDLRHTLGTLLTNAPAKVAEMIAAAGRIELALRERVVEPQKTIRLVISMASGQKPFAGMLKLEPAKVHSVNGQIEGFGAALATVPLEYTGASLQSKTLMFTAPKERGVYRFAIYDNRQADPLACDEIVVQEPTHESVSAHPAGSPISSAAALGHNGATANSLSANAVPAPHLWSHELLRPRPRVH